LPERFKWTLLKPHGERLLLAGWHKLHIRYRLKLVCKLLDGVRIPKRRLFLNRLKRRDAALPGWCFFYLAVLALPSVPAISCW